jgi:hypothetical protein
MKIHFTILKIIFNEEIDPKVFIQAYGQDQNNISTNYYHTTNCLSSKHISIIKHFSIFYSFHNQIERFLCHWTCKPKELQMFFWVSEVKEHPGEHRKRMSDSLLQTF